MEKIKRIYRFLRYKNERRKVKQEREIKLQQNLLIQKSGLTNSNKLIVFLVPGSDWFSGEDNITGGILSIASLLEESSKLNEVHGGDTIMMTHPGEHLLLKHKKFKNNITVYRYDQLFTDFPKLKEIILHIPEYLVPYFLQPQLNNYLQELKKLNFVHINILNQNIRLMPTPNQVKELKKWANLVTQTTAHEKYSSKEQWEKYGISLHKFSVFGGPHRYRRGTFDEKLDRIIISPDDRPYKEQVLNNIKNQLSALDQVIIKNMSYEDYLSTIANTRYAITFGEGLDFYFLETVFCGGVGIAVYNQDFFPESWHSLPGIFSDEIDLVENLNSFLADLENDVELYKTVQNQQYETSSQLYNFEEYQHNIRKFYLGEYTFK